MNEARELLKMARELTASIGYETVLTGGNVGGRVYFRESLSFPANSADDIAKMMRHFQSRVEAYIIKNIPAKVRGASDVRMSSEGATNRSIYLTISFSLDWKREGVLEKTIAYLEANNDVKSFDNQVRG